MSVHTNHQYNNWHPNDVSSDLALLHYNSAQATAQTPKYQHIILDEPLTEPLLGGKMGSCGRRVQLVATLRTATTRDTISDFDCVVNRDDSGYLWWYQQENFVIFVVPQKVQLEMFKHNDNGECCKSATRVPEQN